MVELESNLRGLLVESAYYRFHIEESIEYRVADDPFGETDCSTHGLDIDLLYCESIDS